VELNWVGAINVGVTVEETLTENKSILLFNILIVQSLASNEPLVWVPEASEPGRSTTR
jgi:hypothetical protein